MDLTESFPEYNTDSISSNLVVFLTMDFSFVQCEHSDSRELLTRPTVQIVNEHIQNVG